MSPKSALFAVVCFAAFIPQGHFAAATDGSRDVSTAEHSQQSVQHVQSEPIREQPMQQGRYLKIELGDGERTTTAIHRKYAVRFEPMADCAAFNILTLVHRRQPSEPCERDASEVTVKEYRIRDPCKPKVIHLQTPVNDAVKDEISLICNGVMIDSVTADFTADGGCESEENMTQKSKMNNWVIEPLFPSTFIIPNEPLLQITDVNGKSVNIINVRNNPHFHLKYLGFNPTQLSNYDDIHVHFEIVYHSYSNKSHQKTVLFDLDFKDPSIQQQVKVQTPQHLNSDVVATLRIRFRNQFTNQVQSISASITVHFTDDWTTYAIGNRNQDGSTLSQHSMSYSPSVHSLVCFIENEFQFHLDQPQNYDFELSANSYRMNLDKLSNYLQVILIGHVSDQVTFKMGEEVFSGGLTLPRMGHVHYQIQRIQRHLYQKSLDARIPSSLASMLELGNQDYLMRAVICFHKSRKDWVTYYHFDKDNQDHPHWILMDQFRDNPAESTVFNMKELYHEIHSQCTDELLLVLKEDNTENDIQCRSAVLSQEWENNTELSDLLLHTVPAPPKSSSVDEIELNGNWNLEIVTDETRIIHTHQLFQVLSSNMDSVNQLDINESPQYFLQYLPDQLDLSKVGSYDIIVKFEVSRMQSINDRFEIIQMFTVSDVSRAQIFEIPMPSDPGAEDTVCVVVTLVGDEENQFIQCFAAVINVYFRGSWIDYHLIHQDLSQQRYLVSSNMIPVLSFIQSEFNVPQIRETFDKCATQQHCQIETLIDKHSPMPIYRGIPEDSVSPPVYFLLQFRQGEWGLTDLTRQMTAMRSQIRALMCFHKSESSWVTFFQFDQRNDGGHWIMLDMLKPQLIREMRVFTHVEFEEYLKTECESTLVTLAKKLIEPTSVDMQPHSEVQSATQTAHPVNPHENAQISIFSMEGAPLNEVDLDEHCQYRIRYTPDPRADQSKDVTATVSLKRQTQSLPESLQTSEFRKGNIPDVQQTHDFCIHVPPHSEFQDHIQLVLQKKDDKGGVISQFEKSITVHFKSMWSAYPVFINDKRHVILFELEELRQKFQHHPVFAVLTFFYNEFKGRMKTDRIFNAKQIVQKHMDEIITLLSGTFIQRSLMSLFLDYLPESESLDVNLDNQQAKYFLFNVNESQFSVFGGKQIKHYGILEYEVRALICHKYDMKSGEKWTTMVRFNNEQQPNSAQWVIPDGEWSTFPETDLKNQVIKHSQYNTHDDQGSEVRRIEDVFVILKKINIEEKKPEEKNSGIPRSVDWEITPVFRFETKIDQSMRTKIRDSVGLMLKWVPLETREDYIVDWDLFKGEKLKDKPVVEIKRIHVSMVESTPVAVHSDRGFVVPCVGLNFIEDEVSVTYNIESPSTAETKVITEKVTVPFTSEWKTYEVSHDQYDRKYYLFLHPTEHPIFDWFETQFAWIEIDLEWIGNGLRFIGNRFAMKEWSLRKLSDSLEPWFRDFAPKGATLSVDSRHKFIAKKPDINAQNADYVAVEISADHFPEWFQCDSTSNQIRLGNAYYARNAVCCLEAGKESNQPIVFYQFDDGAMGQHHWVKLAPDMDESPMIFGQDCLHERLMAHCKRADSQGTGKKKKKSPQRCDALLLLRKLDEKDVVHSPEESDERVETGDQSPVSSPKKKRMDPPKKKTEHTDSVQSRKPKKTAPPKPENPWSIQPRAQKAGKLAETTRGKSSSQIQVSDHRMEYSKQIPIMDGFYTLVYIPPVCKPELIRNKAFNLEGRRFKIGSKKKPNPFKFEIKDPCQKQSFKMRTPNSAHYKDEITFTELGKEKVTLMVHFSDKWDTAEIIRSEDDRYLIHRQTEVTEKWPLHSVMNWVYNEFGLDPDSNKFDWHSLAQMKKSLEEEKELDDSQRMSEAMAMILDAMVSKCEHSLDVIIDRDEKTGLPNLDSDQEYLAVRVDQSEFGHWLDSKDESSVVRMIRDGRIDRHLRSVLCYKSKKREWVTFHQFSAADESGRRWWVFLDPKPDSLTPSKHVFSELDLSEFLVRHSVSQAYFILKQN